VRLRRGRAGGRHEHRDTSYVVTSRPPPALALPGLPL
jgi:hypothetical protein